MDQIISVIRRCLPFCFPLPEIESEDQNGASQVVCVEGQNEDVQSNSIITRITSSSSHSGWDHDVFLSFKGIDTRKNFTDHLYNALERVGIRTFRDDEGLNRGEIISSELLNAIRRSRISIVVFSKGYASSRWCLDELAEIVNCKNTIGHTLLPIFYDVDPSDVRKQTKTFAEAFIRHEKRFQTDMESVQRWREALTQAANCSGWNLANEYESQVIDKIVKEVLCKVNTAHLDVAIHPVGMQSRVEHIKALLNLETNDVHLVGFYGMSGIGKTTLAKAVYNEICLGFQASSFLFNVKEKSKESNGLVHLQEQLLYDILHQKNLNVYDVDRGITMIRERIRGKKVLVVLDDVDHLDQLHKLVGNFKLFGPGSRLIATSRDEQLLDQLEVDKKYKVNELNHWESIQLFKWYAFKMNDPIKEHLELSVSVVKYCGGLPLALKVLGSSLVGRSVAEWISKLEKLQKFPDGEIQKKLETSLDSLEYETRAIFLDIACFFIGIQKEYVSKILACDFPADDGLGILIRRSLVTIEDNELRMHDLIRDMGRGIVYAESPRNPGRRSRLWFHKDITNVLCNNTGSEIVEGLILNHHVLEGVPLKTEAFKNMKNLRLLEINDVHLTGSYEDLSKELKWLCWHNCPLKSLPQDFHLEYLGVLDMQHSNLEQVWGTKKIFNNLKVLNLNNSKYLTISPDFSQVPELEILILEGCTSLVQVHESIGHLKRLELLNLNNCTNLKYLPRSTFNLESLKTLDWPLLEKSPKQLPSPFGLFMNLEHASFSKCSSLTELPNFLHAPHLKSLNLEGCTKLVEIHESIGHLNGLVWLNLKGCTNLTNLPSSISNLESLQTLELLYCCNLERLPEQLGNMTALTTLLVGFTAIKQLPSSFKLLKNLLSLSFRGCKGLIKSPEFSETSRLSQLTFEGCTSLLEIHESIGHLKELLTLELTGCKNLTNLPSSISNLESLQTLELWNCCNLERLPEQLGNMTALTALLVGHTAIKQLPSSIKLLKNLVYLSFTGCKGLIKSPEFSETSRLSKLTFAGCTSLLEIHESIGHLKELHSLELNGCKKLRSLPISSTSKLISLGSLILSDCSKFDMLPEQWGMMKALSRLDADGTAIVQLPSSSWVSPSNSNRMSLLSNSKLRSLMNLDLSDCNLSEDFTEFQCLSSLEILNLSSNNFRNLPSCISCLPILRELYLSECTNLQSISPPRSVQHLGANGCTSLERIVIQTNESSGSSNIDFLVSIQNFRLDFILDNCRKLVEIQNLERLLCLPSNVQMGSCSNLSSEFRKSVLQMMWKTGKKCSVLLPGSEIPNCISHQAIGSSVSFRVPPFMEGKMGKVLLCMVFAVNKEAPRDRLDRSFYFEWRLRNKSSGAHSNNYWGNYISRASNFDIFEDHMEALVRTGDDRIKIKSGDEIEVAIFLPNGCGIDPQIVEVKRCGIHFAVEPIDPQMGRDSAVYVNFRSLYL